MITSFIQGGLGNQLFQIAAGFSLAKKLEVDFILHDGQHHLPKQGSRIETYKTNILKNIRFSDLSQHPFKPFIWELAKFNPIPQIDNQLLIGYFQSEKYFEDHIEDIKKLFALPKVTLPPNSVSLHVRRGDYLSSPDIHPTLTSDYYYKALDLIGDYSNIYVFTDSEIPPDLKLDNMIVVSKNSDYDDLIMMSSCEHNIIANSTFSWWAAYLNSNQDKKIIAPKTWFGPKVAHDWQDIYCKGWEVI